MEQLGLAITMIKDLVGESVTDGEISGIAGVVFADWAKEIGLQNVKWCQLLNNAREQVAEYVSHIYRDLHADSYCKVSSLVKFIGSLM